MINYNINKELFNPSKTNQNNKLNFDDISVNDIRVDAIRTYDLDVDFGEYSNTPISTNIIFINGDRNTSIIKAKILMNKNMIELNGITVSINLKEGKTGNDIYSIICTDVDTINNIVTVDLEPYSVDLVGINTFEFVLTKGDKVLISQRYTYEIKESIGEGYIGESEQETALQTLINKTQYLIDQLKFNITEQDIQEIISMIE